MSFALNSKLLILIAIGAVVLAIVVLSVTIGPVVKRAASQAKTKVKGRDAVATIRAVADTGVEVNERAQIKLSVWVEPREIPAYAGEFMVTLSAVELVNSYQVGAQIRVRYDPEDPSQLALVGPYPDPAAAGTPSP